MLPVQLALRSSVSSTVGDSYGLLDHRQRVRVEFKSKAVVHFDQHKALIASASLADNGTVHTVAFNALTIFHVVHDHPILAPDIRTSDWLCRKLSARCTFVS